MTKILSYCSFFQYHANNQSMKMLCVLYFLSGMNVMVQCLTTNWLMEITFN